MSLETVIVPRFYKKNCGKIYIVFYTFHFQKYINSRDSFDKKYVDLILLSPKCTQYELRQLL